MIAIQSMVRGSVIAPLVVALALGAASSALAGGSPLAYRTVALTGDPAPGTEPGVMFGALTTALNHAFLTPQLDEAGRVAFMAILTGPGVTTANVQGMWAEEDGVLGLLARGGLSAPGTSGGVVFLGVPSLEIPFPPIFGGGVASFGATLSGPGVDVTNDEGTWVGTPGNIALFLRQGGAAPGLPGVTFGQFATGTINASGHQAAVAGLSGAGVNANNSAGIFTNRSGALALFLREGTAAPQTEAGTTFGDDQNPAPFGTFSFIELNDNSNLAMIVNLVGPSVDNFRNEALYVERNGALTLLAREGNPAPGMPVGVTFGGNTTSLLLQSVSFNDHERAAFSIRVGGAMPTTSVVYSDRAGALLPIAVPGEPAPGTDFDFSILGLPLLNDADRIAFSAAFPDDDMDPFTPPPFGIFSDVDGTLTAVVSPGDVTTAGDIIANARLTHFNAAGQMLMNATIELPTFRNASVLRDTDGSLHTVAATGQSFDVAGDGSDVRQIIRAFAGGMNQAGEVALRLDFSDNSSGHFVASLRRGGLLGDFDGDGDVDLADFAVFAQCFGGPELPPAGACLPGVNADLDGDGDVDTADFAVVAQHFTGAQ